MEIADSAAQVIATGVTVFMLSLSMVMFASLFSLLIGALADWIQGSA